MSHAMKNKYLASRKSIYLQELILGDKFIFEDKDNKNPIGITNEPKYLIRIFSFIKLRRKKKFLCFLSVCTIDIMDNTLEI